MASQFKNRLVGVTILVASVVIFLPSIIDGKKMAYEDEFVATPIKPETKVHTLAGQQGASRSTSAISEEQLSRRANSATAADDRQQTPVGNDQWEVEEIPQTITLASPDAVEEPEMDIQPTVEHKQSDVAVLENAWTIQLGAFQNAANINLLLKKLHKAGYQAHTVPAEVIDGELTRVFVGPDVSKSKLQKQLPQLKHLTQLQGKIMPFNPVNP